MAYYTYPNLVRDYFIIDRKLEREREGKRERENGREREGGR